MLTKKLLSWHKQLRQILPERCLDAMEISMPCLIVAKATRKGQFSGFLIVIEAVFLLKLVVPKSQECTSYSWYTWWSTCKQVGFLHQKMWIRTT